MQASTESIRRKKLYHSGLDSWHLQDSSRNDLPCNSPANHHENLQAEFHAKHNHEKLCAKQANQAKQGKQANLDGTARREKVCAMLTILTMLEVLK